jgi:hypothetical protein
MNKTTWLLLCFVVVGFLFYVGSTLNTQSRNQVTNYESRDKFEERLKSQFANGYETKSLLIGNSLISASYVSTRTTQLTDALPCDSYSSPLPKAIVYENSGNAIPRTFNIDINGLCITNYDFFKFDLDGDGRDEVISQWEADAGGSGGLLGLVAWKVDEATGLRPFVGLPGDGGYLSVKSLEGSLSTTYPTLSTWDYFKYDFSTDKVLRINVARYIWDTTPTKENEYGESHSSPHIWHLSSYIFDKDRLVIDPNWNDGKEYVTDHKIYAFEEGAIELDNLFIKLRK